ncbi:MAG: monovalent cation/H+ antiporter subunit A [Arenimonas sp. SCN 70-307]|uniref:monovalent cation/H+ antiporter subunit A n=1 Tax=Arenimonas sp. SCN 70-307 TaxID=1660089 RepID=UPI00086B16C1|nr:monovalent cation/H+ antiporter subunit A [Arenimonas sp. SCN 70-307]ODS63186.1 MAG: monovalent cation/H+ antiporter subunit A [Arenimonas sp. SCN 70-307]
MLELLLATPFVLALLVGALPRARRRTAAWLAGLAPVAGLVLLALLTSTVVEEGAARSLREWIPGLGLAFSLRLDGLAWMFAGLVLGIGGLIVLYARYYLSEDDSMPRFLALLLLFMGAMLGMVLAGNLLLLAVFWEMTSISSFLLIGFWHHRRDARDGARMALVITGAGGLALLAGVVMIGNIVGSYELDVVLASGEMLLAHPLYPWVLVLVLAAVFTKSAQFPFHFWLPQAMAAPTPVSAYLHSATMVKAGVFLLARLHPALAGSDLFMYLVSTVGAVTLLVGSWYAIFQHDLKGLLAYSTISHLGLITLLLGLSTDMAVVAALFHIINHATFKASLFMAAGIIDHEAGTRDMRRLGGLLKFLPVTGALAILASLAMAGIPLLNGFLSKEMFFAEALAIEGHELLRFGVPAAALLFGAFGMAYSLRFVHDTFFGKGPRAVEAEVHEPVRFMRAPVALLVVACLVVGIAPGPTVGAALEIAARGVLGPDLPYYSLSIWHGFNLPLAMSAAGVLAGIALYFGLRRLFDLHAVVVRATGHRLFRLNIDTLFRAAQRATKAIANGSLQRSLTWLVVAAVVAGAAPYVVSWPGGGLAVPDLAFGQAMGRLEWVIWVLLVGSTLMTLVHYRQRLLAVIVIGGVGLAVSLTFVALSAPDLALTQLLVEMVTLSLLLLGMHYLPASSSPERSWPRRLRDGAIAAVAGLGTGALAYAMMTRPPVGIADELLARSLPEAWGTNVVNVILVDFRGFDTFGEITVFGIAALVVHAMLRRARMAPEAVMPGPPAKLPVPADLAQIMFPLTLTVSIFLFLRGHNQPGGGFIAGLTLAVPLLIQYVIQGAASVESRFGFDYIRLVAVGLAIAAITGLVAMALGLPFLTSGYTYLDLPLLGKIPLSSAAAFDLGVYLVVFGGTMLILSMMGTLKPSRRLEARTGVLDPARRSPLTAEVD